MVFSLGIPRQRETYSAHKYLTFNLLGLSCYYARMHKSSTKFMPHMSSLQGTLSALFLNLSRSHHIQKLSDGSATFKGLFHQLISLGIILQL